MWHTGLVQIALMPFSVVATGVLTDVAFVPGALFALAATVTAPTPTAVPELPWVTAATYQLPGVGKSTRAEYSPVAIGLRGRRVAGRVVSLEQVPRGRVGPGHRRRLVLREEDLRGAARHDLALRRGEREPEQLLAGDERGVGLAAATEQRELLVAVHDRLQGACRRGHAGAGRLLPGSRALALRARGRHRPEPERTQRGQELAARSRPDNAAFHVERVVVDGHRARAYPPRREKVGRFASAAGGIRAGSIRAWISTTSRSGQPARPPRNWSRTA